MITRDQALALRHGEEIHENGCKQTVGPRGGIKEYILRYRVSGQCQTWVREPKRFRFPVKYGLYGNGEVTETTAPYFHLVSDCPLVRS